MPDSVARRPSRSRANGVNWRLAAALLIACWPARPLHADDAWKPRIRIAFTSLRERPLYTVVYFYEHDGIKTGKIVGKIATMNARSDHHPALSSDGKVCVFAAEVVAKVSDVLLWDVGNQKMLPLPWAGKIAGAQMAPSINGDGKLIAFEAWNRGGSPGRWDILLFDRAAKTLLDLPGLNTTRQDERKPALSRDGRWIGYTSNAADGTGQTDVRLYDRQTSRVLRLPRLNSPHTDTEPALSGDGRLIAFVSDRPREAAGRAGTRDIYLYDRQERRLLGLPGLNSLGQEQSPALTADGRYVAFVSERLDGAGERDLLLYDRRSGALLPTPGLNSPMDEYDPSVVGN